MAKKAEVILEDNIPEVIKLIDEKVIKLLYTLGKFIEGEVIERTPVGVYSDSAARFYDTGPFKNKPMVGGNLRASYTHEVNEKEKWVAIGSPVYYAPYVEFGTSKMAARPHLFPAVNDNLSHIERMTVEILREVEKK